MPLIVHQFIPMLEPGAVGAHTLLVRAALRAAGHESEIFATEVAPASGGEGARDPQTYTGGADVAIYQMAIGARLADAVGRHGERLVVNYHNLTPVRYLTGWDGGAVHGVTWGRAQLHSMAERAALGLADSRYNEAELIDADFGDTAVAPVLFELPANGAAPTTHADTSWLFVGRIAAHKAQHDVVKAFAAYRDAHDPHARLTLAGGGLASTYGRALTRFVHELDLDPWVSLPGFVADDELAALYRAADVFVSCSDHEGFCIPLVEAMHHGVPIVAYAAGAVPETLGDAGVALDTKDPWTIAAAVHRVLSDRVLQDALRTAGHARREDFALERSARTFVDAVTS
ncbi:MAG TPA: glycosyltransferase [Acidimicrobiia bacterium]|nr:glycosyltransferase [Acidimicrobiia bacterium]